MDRTLETIRNRIDNYGVAEPVIQQVGDDRILVQLPGFTDIDAAKSLVEETGFLEFREVELMPTGDPVNLGDYLDGTRTGFFDSAETADRLFVKDYLSPDDPEWGNLIGFLAKTDSGVALVDIEGNLIDTASLPPGANRASSWVISRGGSGAALTGELLKDAQPNIDQSQVAPKYVVSIEWDNQGAEIFDDVAARLYARPENSMQRSLGIFLDNNLLSSPQILRPEYDGTGQIEGGFTPQEVEKLANFLSSGALPMPLKQPPLYQEKISATLGADFIEMSWLAGLIGIILVMIFMIAYYKIPGFLASLALVFYGALVLAIFKLWPVTLSLAGLGGFILSIGMAVDANVLIFERMKEELRAGRTLGAAIEAGFNRAWSAIRDSNITTIIVCLILIWLASSIVASAPVMGFAWTLLIGVVVSMFTAILVTRTLLRLFVGGPLAKKTGLFSVDWGKKQ
jgi:protein-export membrane protein SecD